MDLPNIDLRSERALVLVPTYNERDNVVALCSGLLELRLPFDILFVDDASPDGTGKIIDDLAAAHPNVKALHRRGKLGIGTAHLDGIHWAYENGYRLLVTMDCDFTHPPEYVGRLFSALTPDTDIVIGSRYLSSNSLPGWALSRRVLTQTGHFVTRTLLGMPYDATGALRLYRISRIPREIFSLVNSKGYSFFFESLFILKRNGFRITEIPISLPARTYGHSKMTFGEIRRSVSLLWSTFFISRFSPEKYQYVEPIPRETINAGLVDEQGWEYYWQAKKPAGGLLYDAVASFYRKFIIQRSLRHFITKYFSPSDTILHAGCGSGQVDLALKGAAQIHALDISVNALHFYKKTNGIGAKLIHGSIFDIPEPTASLDGIYNLGVMEHFTEEEIHKILLEFRRVLKPGGKAVLMWPPEHGLSVLFFKGLKKIFALLGNPDKKFHPDEITRLRSKNHAMRIIQQAGLNFVEYSFGPRDLFTYSIVVAEKPHSAVDADEAKRRAA